MSIINRNANVQIILILDEKERNLNSHFNYGML